jgi:hypothetical protein
MFCGWWLAAFQNILSPSSGIDDALKMEVMCSYENIIYIPKADIPVALVSSLFPQQ